MKKKNIIIYAGILLSGLFIGYLLFGGETDPQSMEDHIAETHTDAEGNIIYTCSMHPQVREEEPGNCPICGMELIPAGEPESNVTENNYTLTMTNAAVKLAEIQTSPVLFGNPVHRFSLPGKVMENQNNVSSVTAHFPGRIRNLYVDYEGSYVQKGQKLASVYSPELIAAQQELLETMKYRTQNPRLYEASRQKLRLWEFPESTIDKIEASGEIMTELDFYSPVSGYISEVAIAREEHIMEGGLMYRVVNLSSVWVDFQAYESNIANIKEGDRVQFSVEALPGTNFESTVIYVDPFLDNESRSATIRTKIQNPEAKLKPGMLARANIQSSVSDGKALMVPRSAVMWTGKRSIVYVQVQNTRKPTFEAREVEIGQRAGDYYVVESGLKEGELVVTNGTFKIDSAAQLQDKLSMMNREPGSGANQGAHDHGSMDMKEKEEDSEEITPSQHQNMPANANPETQDKQNAHLDMLVEDYLKIKNALVADDLEKAQQYLEAFRQEANKHTSMRSSYESEVTHAERHNMIMNAVNEAAQADDLETFRLAFRDISEQLIKVTQDYSFNKVLYKQYCPMYKGGSTWISATDEIKNPFYGKQMHNCGETVEQM